MHWDGRQAGLVGRDFEWGGSHRGIGAEHRRMGYELVGTVTDMAEWSQVPSVTRALLSAMASAHLRCICVLDNWLVPNLVRRYSCLLFYIIYGSKNRAYT